MAADGGVYMLFPFVPAAKTTQHVTIGGRQAICQSPLKTKSECGSLFRGALGLDTHEYYE